MSNTGSAIAKFIRVEDQNGDFSYYVPENATAIEIVDIVTAGGNSQIITVAQGQYFVDNRTKDCSGNGDCDDCLVCDSELQIDEYFHDFERVEPSGDVTQPSAFLEIAGQPVCWKLQIQ